MEAQSIKKLNDKLLLASHLMNERKYQDAKIILLEYIQYVEPLIKKSTKEISFCFSNVAEFYIYTQQNKLKKSVSWVSYKLDIAYQWLAYIANEEGKYKEALNYIEKGLQYNPMNTDLIYEECETYKLQKNWDKLYNATKKVYPIIITARDMAKYYRALGYYFIEKGIFSGLCSLYV